jgi:hypothetical protein
LSKKLSDTGFESMGNDNLANLDIKNSLIFLDVARKALGVRTLEDLSRQVLPEILSLSRSSGVMVYVGDPIFEKPQLLQVGFAEEMISRLEEIGASQLKTICDHPDYPLSQATIFPPVEGLSRLYGFSLSTPNSCQGLIAFAYLPDEPPGQMQLLLELVQITHSAVSLCIETAKYQEQINHLSAYMTISSMLTQALGLHQLLETALYFCMEVVSAEAASVLLLDDEKTNFHFYQVEGSTKPLLMKATFSADTGIAGAILHNQESEIINDVPNDPRFYGVFDSKLGFRTRNMIALPLTAGEERLGVFEIINKADGKHFSPSDRLTLISISEEISFAIRNAKIFEYVVNSYCKQRQGFGSCKGCTKPLGSWTPCVQYRESEI